MFETYWNLIKEKILALDTKTEVLIGVIIFLLISMIWASLKTFGILVLVAAAGYLIYWLYEKARE